MAYFLFPFSHEDATEGAAERPERWLLADFRTGELLFDYSCAEIDFSLMPAGFRFTVSDDNTRSITREEIEAAMELLEEIRAQYLRQEGLGNLEEYLAIVERAMPGEYRRFYRELAGMEEIDYGENEE